MSDGKVFAERSSNRTEPPDIDPVALLAGTTPGPWAIEGDYVMDKYRARIIVMLGTYSPDDPYTENDAALIAAAPELAAALVEARARITELEASRPVIDDDAVVCLRAERDEVVGLLRGLQAWDDGYGVASDDDEQPPEWEAVRDYLAALDGEGT